MCFGLERTSAVTLVFRQEGVGSEPVASLAPTKNHKVKEGINCIMIGTKASPGSMQ